MDQTDTPIIHGYQFNDIVGDNVFISLYDDDTGSNKEFTHVDNIGYIFADSNKFYRMVTVPDDAKIKVNKYSYASSDLNIWDPCDINELEIWSDEDVCNINMKRNGLLLQYVKDKTYRQCFDAINNNPKAYLYVDMSDDALDMLAVKGDGSNIAHVGKQTDELQMVSVTQDIRNVDLITNPCDEVVKFVVDRDPNYVKKFDQTYDLCKYLLTKDRDLQKYIDDKNLVSEILDELTSKDGITDFDIFNYDKFDEENFVYKKFMDETPRNVRSAIPSTHEMLSIPGTNSELEEDELL